jgi:hypothetical protein
MVSMVKGELTGQNQGVCEFLRCPEILARVGQVFEAEKYFSFNFQ